MRFPFRLAPARTKTPRENFGIFLDDVQMSHIFPDSKTFVDSIPLENPRAIVERYKKGIKDSGGLLHFIQNNFVLPETSRTYHPHKQSEENIRNYIQDTWKVLTRTPDRVAKDSSLLPLPYPYVVPGDRFREMYYWDSYFTMIGLRESGEIELVKNMAANFVHLINTYGFVPNANRSYYLTRSQPPMFALMVKLLAQIEGEEAYRTYLPAIQKEYVYWMRGARNAAFQTRFKDAALHVVRMPGGEILNRYFDSSNLPREESFREDTLIKAAVSKENSKNFYQNIRAGAESGWDFSSRWLHDRMHLSTIRTTDIVPVDLNVLLFLTEEIIAAGLHLTGDKKEAEDFEILAHERRDAIRRYFWNSKEQWFCDFVQSEQKQSPILSLAGIFPLFGEIATSVQAREVADTLWKRFLVPGGLITTLSHTGEQWDAPNGWAPLHYAAVVGLEHYGFSNLAREIAERWCFTVIRNFENTGALLEKYNVEKPSALADGGEYVLQQGFGWTNAVTLFFMNKYGIMKPHDGIA